MILYHGSKMIVESPEIRIQKYNKDFYFGFYCTMLPEHAHAYDIVEGPMANDTIFNYVQNFVDGKISREAFWALAKFKNPTHQISFHTARALATLSFVKGSEVRDEK